VWLKKYFDTRAKPVQSLQTLLKELRATDMSTELPGLAGSLDAVRVLPTCARKNACVDASRCAFCSGSCCSPSPRSLPRWRRGSTPLCAAGRAAVSRGAVAHLLLILIVGGFAALYFGLRMIVRTVQLPAQVREWRRLQKKDRARVKLDAAIVALLEGRYGKAQQEAQEALALPHSSGLAALVAARAAIDVRQFDAAEGIFPGPRRRRGASRCAIDSLRGNRAGAGQPRSAADPRSAETRAGMHTAALRLELRATQAARRFGQIPPLVEQLVKRGVFDAAQGEQVRIARAARTVARAGA